MKRHVFVIGSKGIPARYGGYETFVDNLTKYKKDESIQYHIACAVDNLIDKQDTFNYNGADCFNIVWKRLGSAKAIFYDIDAIKWSINYIKNNNIKEPIVYVLACRIGPFFSKYVKIIHKLGGKVYINPDGHEWMRSKWSYPVKKYWKYSEKMMVKWADLVICDSKNIEKYINKTYISYQPKTTFIAYGAEVKSLNSESDDNKLLNWFGKNNLKPNDYYLIVGRFVPENNYETMIREFMNSQTKKSLVIITNINDKFFNYLKTVLKFENDERIKFVGTVYDSDLLSQIRENAYAYIHGHEVGGTNPSLLEALAFTKINLLLDVGFNREVGEDNAMYWSKNHGDLASLINKVEKLSSNQILSLGLKAKNRIVKAYSWDFIVDEYEHIFCDERMSTSIIV